MNSKRICLGQIGAANGIKGHLRVKPFTEEPEAFGDYGKLEDETGTRKFKINSLRPIKSGMLVVKFEDINDRNTAEALTGTKLFVDRIKLPDLDDEDDFYIEDLIGLSVFDTNEISFGKVVDVHNFGAGDLLDVKPDRGPSVLVPFTKAAVPKLSLKANRLIISLNEAGLVADDDETSGQEETYTNKTS